MFRSYSHPQVIAYFTMEVGLDAAIPTYSGGLGILAGDTVRAAADLGVPLVGVTLLHRSGYFCQRLDSHGNQYESPYLWRPEDRLEPLLPLITVSIEGRPVQVRAWRYLVRGVSSHTVPVYFLDTALPQNTPWDRELTSQLYGGDDRYRLCQEVVLGFGGVAMLRALGYSRIGVYHMNEGHSALLTLALLEDLVNGRLPRGATAADKEAVRQSCVFTTHTPIPAGHDRFPLDLVRRVLGPDHVEVLQASGCSANGDLNMTYLALHFSRYVNGVSMRHEETSRSMFPEHPIGSITNGVHALTWTSSQFQRLFDRFIPQWRTDNLYLRYATAIPLDEIRQSHMEAKYALLAEVHRRTGIRLSPKAMTLGFARRATAYKRPHLLLSHPERLRRMASAVGPIQILYGGKAHPRDDAGKALIRRTFETAAVMGEAVRVLYLEEYDISLAKYFCSGVDLWVNTPEKPQEASGTSGMKAALNGVPSLSIRDGWWVEGHVEGVTGWAIDEDSEAQSNYAKEAASLYDRLERVILPMYHQRPDAYAEVMRSAIALNGSYFNAQRMLMQYLKNSYQNGVSAPESLL
ncbi:MAG: alpha-glucan family phosphorylase [Chloroflexi bacterium]|nr:alpha-glucan family phosphorylase [Chloroflexota bacterium]